MSPGDTTAAGKSERGRVARPPVACAEQAGEGTGHQYHSGDIDV